MKSRNNSRSAACLLALLAALPALSGAAARADSQPAPMPQAMSSAQGSVVVKIGQASLEEYQHGDPGNRIQLLRGALTAQKAATSSSKSRS